MTTADKIRELICRKRPKSKKINVLVNTHCRRKPFSYTERLFCYVIDKFIILNFKNLDTYTIFVFY